MEMNEENPTGLYLDEDGHLTSLGLSLYAEFLRGGLVELPGELEQHVGSCSYCRQELMSVADLLDEVDQVEEEPVDYQSKKNTRAPSFKKFLPLIRTAAALAAIVLISWVIQQVLRDRPDEPMAGTGNTLPVETNRQALEDPMVITQGAHYEEDTSNAGRGREGIDSKNSGKESPAVTDQYAMAFVPNPAYESLIGGKFRATRDPQVSGPEMSTAFSYGDTLRFSWSPGEDDAYTLIIVDNQANEVREVDAGTGSWLEWRIDLPPGLYYWKFTGREHLWKAGKFTVGLNR
ncbi:MAG: hypothetical protein R6V75_04040 [Bacteroidales bacterium]